GFSNRRPHETQPDIFMEIAGLDSRSGLIIQPCVAKNYLYLGVTLRKRRHLERVGIRRRTIMEQNRDFILCSLLHDIIDTRLMEDKGLQPAMDFNSAEPIFL